MKTSTLTLADLEALHARLIPKAHLSLSYNPVHEHDPNVWRCVLAMEKNVYPYWMSYSGPTPDVAVGKLLGYLDGTVPDHAADPRPPAAWLKK